MKINLKKKKTSNIKLFEMKHQNIKVPKIHNLIQGFRPQAMLLIK